MNKYKITVIYRYVDTVDVEAATEEQAIEFANEIADPEYDCFYDAVILSVDEI
jgi:hypothetical protein